MSRFLFVAAVVFVVGCNCGNDHQKCTVTNDCPVGQVCSAGLCYSSNGGSGGTGNGVGGSGNGAGGSGNGAGGTGNGAGGSGGTCVGLQCQQTTCTGTGCTVPACTGGAVTTVSGHVYEPAGQLALYNVIVYVPNSAVQAFTPGVSCEQCGASITGSPLVITSTDTNGHFTLSNVPVGTDIPLVMQIGHWRRQIKIPTVTACIDNPQAAGTTRLPRNKLEGDIPQMAIATGSADPFECLLLKMGISASEFTAPTAAGRVHYFVENGTDMAPAAPAGSTLYGSLPTLKNYDVVFLPCEGAENPKGATNTKNLVDYTTLGGRAFVTHYGYVWTAMGSAPFPSTAAWTPSQPNPNNPISVTLNQGFPKGLAFTQWLQNNGAATNGVMSLIESRHDVGTLGTAPATTAWMHGDYTAATNGSTYNWTPHLTFNVPYNPPALPDGGPGLECGRVVFSDFHVSGASAVTAACQFGGCTFPTECQSGPYTAQEKALVFMVFDLSSCITNDNTIPTVCKAIGETCTTAGDCCAGLTCPPPPGGELCTGTNCVCTPPIG